MGTRGRIFVSAGLVLGAGLSVVACGGGSSGAPALEASGQGQSCTRTSDCASGLVCVAEVCSATSDAGPPRDAGAEAAPRLGQAGEACLTAADCASGLECVVSTSGSVCDEVSYGLTPTGKTCKGECETNDDCCELPVGLGDVYYVPDGGTAYVALPIHGCQDILTALGGDAGVCSSGAGPSGANAKQACFYYETYCACATGTWSCAANQCSYTAPCTAATSNTLGGCPTSDRLGPIASPGCDLATKSCVPDSSCSTAADCDGKAVVDVTGATCAGGDCVCQSGACYLPCKQDIDCAAGSACDAATKLCKPAGCATDADCAEQTNDALATCSGGACRIPCTTDYDCSPPGDVPGTTFAQQVCSSGFCQALGCSSDADCASGSVHLFCVTPPAPAEHSAITD